jgi:GTP-binding protein
MSKPVVAIVGRPNVGKSTLFNRLVGRRKAIVADLPGTTRDRLYGDISWKGWEFTVMDMGGLEARPGSAVKRRVKEQIQVGIDEADLVLFVLDVRGGLLADDWDIADVLRRSGKPVILVANKTDRSRHQDGLSQLYELGMEGDFLCISAYHDRGIEELLDRIILEIPAPSPDEEPPEAMRVSIVGRPNVGKSMLLNAILGQDRAIVDDVPGTTRDAVDTVLEYNGQRVVLVDTAGMRRRGKIEQGVERYSAIRGLEAVERSDVKASVLRILIFSDM